MFTETETLQTFFLQATTNQLRQPVKFKLQPLRSLLVIECKKLRGLCCASQSWNKQEPAGNIIFTQTTVTNSIFMNQWALKS